MKQIHRKNSLSSIQLACKRWSFAQDFQRYPCARMGKIVPHRYFTNIFCIYPLCTLCIRTPVLLQYYCKNKHDIFLIETHGKYWRTVFKNLQFTCTEVFVKTMQLIFHDGSFIWHINDSTKQFIVLSSNRFLL